MVTRVNMHQAKTELSDLVSRAERGEEVIIMRAGKPVARIVPIRQERQPGSARGLIKIEPGFYSPLPDDLLDAFESG